MSHPIPTHDYSEKTYPSDSPHKDILGGVRKKTSKAKALNTAQKAAKRILGEAGSHFRRRGESPLQHLKRLTK